MAESKNHAREVELADLSAIMKTSGGRSVLARILQASGLFETTFVSGKPDETMKKSVRRDFGVWLERELKEASADYYHTLLKEIDNG